MVLGEAGGDPHDHGRLDRRGVDQELAEVAVVGGLEAVLDDHRAPVLVLADHVQGQVVDARLALDRGDGQAEGVGDDVEVLEQPRGQVGGVVAPDDARLQPLEAAEADPVDAVPVARRLRRGVLVARHRGHHRSPTWRSTRDTGL